MDINEIAKDTYYFSINNKLSGFITERNAIKCFEQLVTKLEPGESIHLPFINVNLKMYSFDHLRMYNIDHINTFCGRR